MVGTSKKSPQYTIHLAIKKDKSSGKYPFGITFDLRNFKVESYRFAIFGTLTPGLKCDVKCKKGTPFLSCLKIG